MTIGIHSYTRTKSSIIVFAFDEIIPKLRMCNIIRKIATTGRV